MIPPTRTAPFVVSLCVLLLLSCTVCGWVFAQQQPAWKPPDPLPPRALLPAPNDYNFIHPPSIPCGEENADLSYKIPLSPQQEKRAMNIYRKSIVILAHTHCLERADFDEMRQGGITAAIVKFDTDGMNFINGTRAWNRKDEDWLPRGMRQLQRLEELAREPGNKLLIARTTADIRRAKRENKLAVILSFEGAKPLAGKLENVDHFYDRGLRELQLWWAVPNELKTSDNSTLSPFGEDVVREMNRRGMVIDMSHMTPQAFGRVLELTTKPTIISHCAVSLDGRGGEKLSGTDHLNDTAIRAMAKNGGSICLHFVTPDYIRARHGGKQGTVADWVDHAVYIRGLVGADYVALGPDYFPEKGWHWIDGAGRVGLMPNIARELVRRGFSDDEIAKVLGANLLRVLEKNWEGR